MVDLQKIYGVFCAVITPVIKKNEKEILDEYGFRKLLNNILDKGIHGIVLLGSAGEFPTLPDKEKINVIKTAIGEIKGRVPVVVGTGNTSLQRTVEDTNTAAELGADVAIVVPPFYYPLTQEGIINYYRELAKKTNIPIILYNIPPFTKINMAPETVQKLSGIERIIGIKDTSRDFEYLQKLMFTVDRTNFRIFLGTDGMLAAGLQIGVDGVIGISGNLDPDLDMELWNSFHNGDFQSALEAQKKIGAVLEIIRTGTFPAALKAAASLHGYVSKDLWSPGTPLPDSQVEEMKTKLHELGYDF